MDGEILIQPSTGSLTILTECGILELSPGIIGVIPKNMKIQVNLSSSDSTATGVITELKNDRSFRLPHRGLLGANGLANPEYF
jgi:homogentisate 1,2-dioxygenase